MKDYDLNPTDNNEKAVVEDCWEDAALFTAEFTPHSSRRIELFYAQLSPLCLQQQQQQQQSNHVNTFVEIQSVDTSSMTLLDVCNYSVSSEHVDGSGHCIWMGALYFIHALSLGMAMTESFPL